MITSSLSQFGENKHVKSMPDWYSDDLPWWVSASDVKSTLALLSVFLFYASAQREAYRTRRVGLLVCLLVFRKFQKNFEWRRQVLAGPREAIQIWIRLGKPFTPELDQSLDGLRGGQLTPCPSAGWPSPLGRVPSPFPLRESPQGFPRRSPVGGWPWPKGSVDRSTDLTRLPQISGRAGIYSLQWISAARQQWRHKFSDWFLVRPMRLAELIWFAGQVVTSWLCRSENATTTSTLCSLARSVKVSTLPLAQLAAVTQNLFMSRDYSCPKMGGGTLFSSWPMLLMLLLQTMMRNDDAHKVNIKAGSIDLENTFQQLTKGSLQNSNMKFFL